MAFHVNHRQSGGTIGEINMIPLIDVMLVLLVIVLVAAPLLTHAVTTDLPRAESTPEQAEPDAITLEIADDGALRLDGEALAAEVLEDALKARSGAKPLLRLLAHPGTPYDAVAKAMAAAGRAGVASVSFVSLPGGTRP